MRSIVRYRKFFGSYLDDSGLVLGCHFSRNGVVPTWEHTQSRGSKEQAWCMLEELVFTERYRFQVPQQWLP